MLWMFRNDWPCYSTCFQIVQCWAGPVPCGSGHLLFYCTAASYPPNRFREVDQPSWPVNTWPPTWRGILRLLILAYRTCSSLPATSPRGSLFLVSQFSFIFFPLGNFSLPFFFSSSLFYQCFGSATCWYGSVPLTNGSGSGSSYFLHWPSRCKFFCLLLFESTFFKDKKLKSHKEVTKQ